jgi:hypothetical protein
VDQLSLPYRIALGALLVVAALWFTVLRPAEPAPEPPMKTQAPGTAGLGNSVDAARDAAAAANASAQRNAAAANGDAAPAKAATPEGATGSAKPAAGADAATQREGQSSDPSAPLLRSLDREKAVVLLFWNRRGSDDRAVRRAVADVDRRNGDVVVEIVPIGRVGRYEAITKGAQVLEAPTTLVIGPARAARPIVGLTTTAEVDQAADDVLAAARKR